MSGLGGTGHEYSPKPPQGTMADMRPGEYRGREEVCVVRWGVDARLKPVSFLCCRNSFHSADLDRIPVRGATRYYIRTYNDTCIRFSSFLPFPAFAPLRLVLLSCITRLSSVSR